MTNSEPVSKDRRLGQTGIELSAVGLGCWQFSKGRGMTGRYWPSLDDQIISQIVERSLAGGINWFDTAEGYGGGESEKALARALDSLDVSRDRVLIATKWWPLLRTARSIIESIDQRLKMLNTDYIDLYQIHLPFSFSPVKSEMRAMVELVKRGKVHCVGLSNYSAKGMRLADWELRRHGLSLASNQVSFNLLDRKIETNGVLDAARELGVSIIAYSPLAQGLLTGKYHHRPDRLAEVRAFRKIYKSFNRKLVEKTRPVLEVLEEIAPQYRVTPAQIALNWVINVHGETVIALVGATRGHHAHSNAAAMQFELSAEHMALLDRVSRAYASG